METDISKYWNNYNWYFMMGIFKIPICNRFKFLWGCWKLIW